MGVVICFRLFLGQKTIGHATQRRIQRLSLTMRCFYETSFLRQHFSTNRSAMRIGRFCDHLLLADLRKTTTAKASALVIVFEGCSLKSVPFPLTFAHFVYQRPHLNALYATESGVVLLTPLGILVLQQLAVKP